MSTPIPPPLRAAAGLAALAIDSARKVPQQLVGLPVLAVSTALQASLKAQQTYAGLVARGDEVLSALRGQQDDPPWATFDEEPAGSAFDAEDAEVAVDVLIEPSPNGAAPRTEPGVDLPTGLAEDAAELADEPPVAGYDTLSIPQLRGRLRSLTLEQVEALVDWERTHGARPPYLTMLENRLTTLRSR
jgi:hypothetical protein